MIFDHFNVYVHVRWDEEQSTKPEEVAAGKTRCVDNIVCPAITSYHRYTRTGWVGPLRCPKPSAYLNSR
jgi:hypothetical protein